MALAGGRAYSPSSFWPTRSLYTFARFTTERETSDFGPVSPDPVIQHGSRSGRTRQFNVARGDDGNGEDSSKADVCLD
jgi:hypothetical protein